MLAPRTLADTDACLAMDQDPEVVRFVQGPWSDARGHRDFIDSRTRGPYPAGMGYWTIRRKGAGATFLGWILLIPVDGVGPGTEIGWRLCRDAWGAGVATEAATPVLHHAFQTLRLSEVVAEIDVANLGSIKVAEKLGLINRRRIDSGGTSCFEYAIRAPEPRSEELQRR